ncbi:conserved Plasmodium protein, unknown function [Plasmodium ovale wallikeri]|uniref:Thioredoxin domain-containing protein n=1 Tax=Plasmodium ovale wallikeri TaxID=864142 RepID=A0A1A8ZUS9_PLAOA|nr:conserved Plasmodium protein, unknown function [Plasmodium ovale wallikeri]SBT52759.1 conserved Plasmodium protein, unknown function [Plasmodium ovale wallikeri]
MAFVRREIKISPLLALKRVYFSTNVASSKNVNRGTFEYIDISDYNYDNIVEKEKAFLLFGYSDYAYRCFPLLSKLRNICNSEQVEGKDQKRIPLYRLNISNNNMLVHKFHIKSIPIIQLRYKNKLIEEISGHELDDISYLKNIVKRCSSYFHPLYDVNNINDFLSREHELIRSGYAMCSQGCPTSTLRNEEDATSALPNGDDVTSVHLFSSTGEMSNEKEREKHISFVEKVKEYFKGDLLDNLHLRYSCASYILYKKLEILLLEKEKNVHLIKSVMNEIITKHSTYLDINDHYSKIMAKGFLTLFDDAHVSSVEEAIELCNRLETYTGELFVEKNEPNFLKLHMLSFNEPIVTFDNFKKIHQNRVKSIEELLSGEEGKRNTEEFPAKYSSIISEHVERSCYTEERNLHKSGYLKVKYLSRLYRILAVKYENVEEHDKALECALKSYKLTFPFNYEDTEKSKILIENIILYLGAYNKSVLRFLSEFQFLFTDKIFTVVRFPHTRAIKGGRPMMKRGKSGKWLWLSQDWKPRWLRRKTKTILEEEWRCVPDKNVPFWN